MGDLYRQYWFPSMPSYELPSPDSPPKRVRFLGEDLVAFRDSDGKVGVFAQSCPHRGASLFFGRNEESGLRCVYHGWKYDVTGACIDMPSEPAESNFKSKVRVKAYPCHEVNKMIWLYMGPREVPPPFPKFEITTLPDEQVIEPRIMMEEANWFQNLEGDIDSVHIDYLHSRLRYDSIASNNIGGVFVHERSASLEVIPTDYGAFYSAKRRWDEDGNIWHRITQYIFPAHSMIAASNPGMVTLRSHVPLDDHYSMMISQTANLERPVTDEENANARNTYESVGGYVPQTSDPRTRYATVANKHNDYFLDRELEKTQLFIGVKSAGNLQDRAMTELMTNEDGIEPIYDRSKEHLASTDQMVIMARRMLIKAAKALRDEGAVPGNVDNPALDAVRSTSIILPPGADWIKETEQARSAAPTKEVVYVVPS
jgi:phenylpropionate dioxygenase-like ring-hydroxylating dioxygenase large terminal subunit